jgi:hypothetical protein
MERTGFRLVEGRGPGGAAAQGLVVGGEGVDLLLELLLAAQGVGGKGKAGDGVEPDEGRGIVHIVRPQCAYRQRCREGPEMFAAMLVDMLAAPSPRSNPSLSPPFVIGRAFVASSWLAVLN